jgi:hypothetical protein
VLLRSAGGALEAAGAGGGEQRGDAQQHLLPFRDGVRGGAATVRLNLIYFVFYCFH